jgi:hypothetical protein
MSNPKQQPKSKNTGRKRTPPKPTPRAGRAGISLRRAVEKLVAQDCEKIARTLVNQTIAGNMTSARLIASLTDAEKPIEKKKRRPPSEALRLAREPLWEGP